MGSGSAARESIVRRGRGYAPDPLSLPLSLPEGTTVLAVGAELKHTFTLAAGSRAHVAPHTGDLEDLLTHQAFEWNLAHLERLLALEPTWAAHDLHPAYLSTQYATRRFPAERRLAVQHHHAHVASCAAEHGVTGRFLGVAYDGLGMGDDGTFWGGELLLADLGGYRRLATLRARTHARRGERGAATVPHGTRLPARRRRAAPDRSGRPWTTAWPMPSWGAWTPARWRSCACSWRANLNAPVASSAGRLFDAVSSLLGLRDVAEFEAQAAIDLEMAADPAEHGPASLATSTAATACSSSTLAPRSWPCWRAWPPGPASRSWPRASSARCVEVTTRSSVASRAGRPGIDVVCLSGGVFQNGWLADALLDDLAGDGFDGPHQRAGAGQ